MTAPFEQGGEYPWDNNDGDGDLVDAFYHPDDEGDVYGPDVEGEVGQIDRDNDHDLPDQNDALGSTSWLDIVKSLLIVAVGLACLALVLVAWGGCPAIGGRSRIDADVDEPLIKRRELE
jgi:hypothetical protein